MAIDFYEERNFPRSCSCLLSFVFMASLETFLMATICNCQQKLKSQLLLCLTICMPELPQLAIWVTWSDKREQQKRRRLDIIDPRLSNGNNHFDYHQQLHHQCGLAKVTRANGWSQVPGNWPRSPKPGENTKGQWRWFIPISRWLVCIWHWRWSQT